MLQKPENSPEKIEQLTPTQLELHKDRAEKFANFLAKFAQHGVVGTACAYAGLRKLTVMDWMKKYPEFKEKFDEIQDLFVDGLEQVAMDRAKSKSDSLLMFLLKAQRRDVYGDKKEVELSAKEGVKLIISDSMLSSEERQQIEQDQQLLLDSSEDKEDEA